MVVDSGGYVFGPFDSYGTNIKYIKTSGRNPNKEVEGPDAVDWTLTGHGDIQVRVTDAANNTDTVGCPMLPRTNLRGRF